MPNFYYKYQTSSGKQYSTVVQASSLSVARRKLKLPEGSRVISVTSSVVGKSKKEGNPISHGYRGSFAELDKRQQKNAWEVYKMLSKENISWKEFVNGFAEQMDWDTRSGNPWAGWDHSIVGDLGRRNPDSTPSDPREIAQDIRILKAKAKLVKLEGKQGNPGGYQTLSIVPAPKGKVGFSLVEYTATPLPSGEMVWRYPKVITHKVTPNRAKELVSQGYKGSYVHRGSLFNKKVNLPNPGSLDSSKGLFESFHGREADGEDDVVSFENIPDHLTQLGELRELVVILPNNKEEITIEFPEENTSTILASAPGGTQYVLVGGDQGIDPDSLEQDFGITSDENWDEWQRKVVLGEVVSLTYFTDKHHLSGPKYQKDGCLYEHQLGEEGGELPTLVYDPNNESLEIVGGSYVTKEEGIRN
jgi:hypothetical protein